jgi:uncharacterized metal-binding protein YceD (DUF177 family)
LKFTEIKIAGLKDGKHSYHFSLDNRFLEPFSRNLFDQPSLEVEVELTLSDTMIKAEVLVKGSVELICDRSLDPFRQLVEEKVQHYFKFGEEETELSDELEVILKERVSIDLDQLVYDIVALSIPAKHLHPRFQELEQEDGEEEGTLVYSSEKKEETPEAESQVDPRWEKLKNLNR